MYAIGAVLEEVEAFYHAAGRAYGREEPFLPHYLAERRRAREAGGISEDVLADIEYTSRTIMRLERAGADREAVDSLRDAVRLLARHEAETVYFGGQRRRDYAVGPPLDVRRVSMASPLDLATSIPPEYWTGGGLVLFISALERKFNAIERIRTERVDLAARRAERRADEREAQLREAQAQHELSRLRDRDSPEDERLLAEMPPQDPDFRLEAGEVAIEHPAQPGVPFDDVSEPPART